MTAETQVGTRITHEFRIEVRHPDGSRVEQQWRVLWGETYRSVTEAEQVADERRSEFGEHGSEYRVTGRTVSETPWMPR